MTRFRYVASDASARMVAGGLDAADERAVVRQLRSSGYYPIRIEPADAPAATSALGRLTSLARRPTRQDVLILTQQLHTLLEAGLEVDRSLAILSDLTKNRRLAQVARDLLADVQRGLSVAESLAKHPEIFSRLYVNMARAGEAGGVLEPVLGRIAVFLERAKAIRDQTVSALTYPALVLLVASGAIVVLLNFVVPRFTGVFADSRHLLPRPTRVLLAVSELSAAYWWLAAGVIALAALGIRGYLHTEEGTALWHRAKLRMPVVGGLVRELEAARFTRTFGTLLQSGVPVLTALEIVGETVGNVVLARALPRIRDGVKRGEGVAAPLDGFGVFPVMAVHMVKVGEETGRLEEMLMRVADIYDAHVTTSLKRLLGLLEPAVILVLGLIVGFIVLSILTAIVSVSDFPA